MVTIFVIMTATLLLSHVAPFPFVLDVTSNSVSLWRVKEPPGRKVVYLSYDDGPNPRVTPRLLDLLRDKEAHATFFVIPERVTADTAPIVRRMFEEGHTVGLHSADRRLASKGQDRIIARLQAGSAHIELMTGRRPAPLFRPHAGFRSVAMITGLRQLGYRLVGWSFMSWDWVWFRRRTGERVASQILAHVAPGKIIVIHDSHHSDPRADRDYAIEATRLIVDGLRRKGYETALLSEPPEETGENRGDSPVSRIPVPPPVRLR